MRIRFDFNHAMADYVAEAYDAIAAQLTALEAAGGLPEKSLADIRRKLEKVTVPRDVVDARFVTRSEFTALEPKLRQAHKNVESQRGDVRRMMAWTRLPVEQERVVAEVGDIAAHVRENFDAFVILGIGGSALGPTAVQAALNHLRYNELPPEARGPKLYVEDNIDPERMAALLDVVDLERTCFNIISKSGNTSETMAQYLIISNLLKKYLPDTWTDHLVFTTDAARGNLVAIARAEELKGNTIRMLVVPDGVGGRFSELSPVGLLAAEVCGIDVEAMLDGARIMDDWCRESDPFKNPALLAAGVMYSLMTAKTPLKNISVMMPYADSLRFIADWYAQLWAESLGKERAKDGALLPSPVGQTPVKAVGATDQHSQVQLYTEGPNDKVVTFLAVDEYRETVGIPGGALAFPDVSFLTGSTLDALIQAERAATEYALMVSGKPSWTITLPRVDERAVGQLLYFFEMLTAYTGDLLGIDAFDQPGVEEGKNATYGLFGRKGYEYKKAELLARPERKPEYLL